MRMWIQYHKMLELSAANVDQYDCFSHACTGSQIVRIVVRSNSA